MANIKTIALNGAEIKVAIAGQNCAIRNDGTDAVYASRTAGITAGADGVLAVPAGQSAILRDTCGTLYLLGTGSVQLVGADYDSVPFKTVSASGGSGADEVARAAISAHAGNAEIHVTSEDKSAWNAKAEMSDIPTSLPANGGNAATLENHPASDFAQNTSTWMSGDVKDLLLSAQSGCVFINNGVTGMPKDGEYWFGQIHASSVHKLLTVTHVNTSIRYDLSYNKGLDTWRGWTNHADGGDAATFSGQPVEYFATQTALVSLSERIAALENKT